MTDLINDVTVWPVNHESLKANVSFTVANAFAVKAKVTMTKNGDLMVQMPSESYKKDGETKYKDLAHPITKEAREEMIKKVIAAYKAETGSSEKSTNGPKKSDGVPF
jgi:stage V sporulation protein G